MTPEERTQQILGELQHMKFDLLIAQQQLAIVKSYVEERIRVDNLSDGFSKGYDQKMIQGKNTEVLLAITKLETLI